MLLNTCSLICDTKEDRFACDDSDLLVLSNTVCEYDGSHYQSRRYTMRLVHFSGDIDEFT